MHYPVLLERELASRWRLSQKALRNWRQRNVGPRWHKLLGRQVRYHVADVMAFESNALPPGLLDLVAEDGLNPVKARKFIALNASPPPPDFVDCKTICLLAKLPNYYFTSPNQRQRLHLPFMRVVSAVRFSPLAVWQWELEHSTEGRTAPKLIQENIDPTPQPSGPVPRWYEML